MLTFAQVGEILDDIADSLPEEFYKELNGGIILLPGAVVHRESNPLEPLYVLGEYRREPFGLGRYIVIHYGSFVRAYGRYPLEAQAEELRRILLHEFTHHIQSLGGTRNLEIDDDLRLDRYRQRQAGEKPE